MRLITTDRELLEQVAGEDGGIEPEAVCLQFMRRQQRPCNRCDGRGLVGHRSFPVVCPRCSGRKTEAV